MIPAFAASTTAIHIEGIKAGDTVYTYKVIKMNTTTGKWEWNIDGMTDAELRAIVGHYDTTEKKYVVGSISEETAAKIANIVKSLDMASVEATDTSTDITGDAGLYCVLVTAGDVVTVYNPAFAAIQYTQDGDEENAASTVDFETLTYSDTAKVKKSEIEVKKVANAGNKGTNSDNTDAKATTNNVGDIVTFTVTTKIPAYADNFTAAKYIVTDNMSEGLEFQSFTSITVGADTAVNTTTGKVGEKTYIKDITTADQSWSLTFDEAYLLTNTTVQDLTIVYTAKVTNAAVKNINPDTNTVEVDFSNNPKNLDDHKVIKDETRHYTFSIDMNVLGQDNYEASEFVKIGVDNEGNRIEEEIILDNGTHTNPLANATFRITTRSGEEGNYTYTDYTNDNSSSWNLTTDAQGKLAITGLDAGTYYLIETSAPSGYIPDKTPIEVVITPTYETINVDPDGEAGSGDEYSYNALKSYTITVGGTTSTYTMTNEGTDKDKKVTKGDSTKEWLNTKGVELPSTGGMGTTILYVGGSILVILAAILLITKRRMSADE